MLMRVTIAGLVWRDARSYPIRTPRTGLRFVRVSRCRSGGLSGFTGMFVGDACATRQDGALAGLRRTKQTLKRSR